MTTEAPEAPYPTITTKETRRKHEAPTPTEPPTEPNSDSDSNSTDE